METTIKKNQTAKIPTKSGKEYSYKYVDIAQIHDYLEQNGMKYIQKIERIDGDDYIMTKRFIEEKWEEEWLQGSKVVDATLFGTDNPAQKQGSALTYARRYSLLMAFGLATEDDDAVSLSKPSNEENKATPKQIDMLEGYCTDEELEAVYKKYNIESLEDLSMEIASKLIARKVGK